jgi:Uncharacterized protein conserved in bacteria (DUF2188)
MPDVHVVASGDQWACEMNGNIRSTHATQAEAIKQARFLAEDQNSELVIHGEDGRILEKDSHGHDPRDIPG